MEHIETIQMLQKLNWSSLGEKEIKEIELKYNLAIAGIAEELKLINNPSVLKGIINNNDFNDSMPIETMFRVYQQLIRIEDDKYSVLENFSKYLLLYGPDWQDDSTAITTALDNGEIENAVQIALQVNYDKYQ
ncbi:hypothetical protein NDK47_21240 [Brevibacillus ruminantium]|uniref:Uncharacterized protein n=1 Tax=Brevibacillus ruminantium TaxID=2950604 RepID=A0ABY4WET9_9BACL|nr:hypothetical protein [Brevibacillus ruminantium]USG64643.1 hypothetical protein NDK47_21240 [Brevibacillus ruminantium]